MVDPGMAIIHSPTVPSAEEPGLHAIITLPSSYEIFRKLGDLFCEYPKASQLYISNRQLLLTLTSVDEKASSPAMICFPPIKSPFLKDVSTSNDHILDWANEQEVLVLL